MQKHPSNLKAVSKESSVKRPYERPQITSCEATEPNALGSSCTPNVNEVGICPKGW